MTLRLEIDPRALAEAESAARLYEGVRPGHGNLFRREVDHVLTMVREHPGLYQQLDSECRRAFLRCFPFVVLHLANADAIQVVAVMPTQSDPAAVEGRVGLTPGAEA